MDWISVEAMLPEDGQKVFVYGTLEHSDQQDIWKATFFKYVDGETAEFWEYEWCYDFEKITHWMPLPKPPNDECDCDICERHAKEAEEKTLKNDKSFDAPTDGLEGIRNFKIDLYDPHTIDEQYQAYLHTTKY